MEELQGKFVPQTKPAISGLTKRKQGRAGAALLVVRGFAHPIIQALKREHCFCLCQETQFSCKTPLVQLKPVSLCKHPRRKAEGAKAQGYSELWNLLHYYCVFGQHAESLGGVT